jgi:hypothetical protein
MLSAAVGIAYRARVPVDHALGATSTSLINAIIAR